jgi:GT2 family glycosyltransferase
MPRYSVIIPVYNRPEELSELLQSLILQTHKDFEVIVVEDGSNVTSEKVVVQFSAKLAVQYFVKPNSGPGPSRNFGFGYAAGDYFVVFDSDCILPPHYFEAVDTALKEDPFDAWGGPDRGSPSFTPKQQAMAYTMSSVLTTGGIRGTAAIGFQPRSFNMGFSRKVFTVVGGFHLDRAAEDIDLSIRIRKNGFRIKLVPDAYVFHKRRSTFIEFFKQVSGFGRGRVVVTRIHRGTKKPTHYFPTLFLCGLIAVPFLLWLKPLFGLLLLLIYLAYLLSIAIGCFSQTKSLRVSGLSMVSAVVQLTGYGSGFLQELLGIRP